MSTPPEPAQVESAPRPQPDFKEAMSPSPPRSAPPRRVRQPAGPTSRLCSCKGWGPEEGRRALGISLQTFVSHLRRGGGPGAPLEHVQGCVWAPSPPSLLRPGRQETYEWGQASPCSACGPSLSSAALHSFELSTPLGTPPWTQAEDPVAAGLPRPGTQGAPTWVSTTGRVSHCQLLCGRRSEQKGENEAQREISTCSGCGRWELAKAGLGPSRWAAWPGL